MRSKWAAASASVTGVGYQMAAALTAVSTGPISAAAWATASSVLSSSATARPMPEPAPVTSAPRPSSLIAFSFPARYRSLLREARGRLLAVPL